MRSLRELLFPNCNRGTKFWASWSGDARQHRGAPAWRDLYVAAVLEPNNECLAERIAKAKQALVLRARELFGAAGDHIDEETAIDDTLQALHALEQYRLRHCSFPQPHVNLRT